MRPGNPLRWIWSYFNALLRVPVRLFRNPGSLGVGAWAFLAFLAIYLLLLRYCSRTYFRDPTSAFFDPVRGYERIYSLQRQKQADAFIERSKTLPPNNTPLKKEPKLCIGIATVGRENEQYIRSTIGSLLEPLSGPERADIYLAVLIAHTDPQNHPIYNETWLIGLADKVILYDVPDKDFDQLIEWEKDKNYVRKAIFDYTYVMQKCVDKGAQWIAMIEDDTLAMGDWYPRVQFALERADDQHRADGAQGEWLYLRLFFTEEFLGWNSEEWPWYLVASTFVVAASIVVLIAIRRFTLRNTLTNLTIAVCSFVCVPALIVLYFLAGRLSMSPLQPGVYEMPKFGCCAQGLVFSSSMATKTIAHLREVGAGYVDVLIEAWANEMGYVRWVVMPSLLQHVGGHSSKGDDFGGMAKWERSVAEKIWNFGYELYDERTF